MRSIIVSIFVMLLVAPVLRAADLNVGDLRCEYRENPIGIDTISPRFSWVLNSDQQAESQTAYQILVATTADLLGKDTGDLWDTGKVKSTDAIQIPYAGKALVSGERYFWKVRVWDKNDSPSDWTEPATWTMGLLTPGDWRAQWIGRGDDPRAADLQTAQWIWPLSGNSTSAPGALAVFRKSFEMESTDPAAQTWLVLAASDTATIYLDGKDVGSVDDPLRARTFNLGPLAPGKHDLSVMATSTGQRDGIVGAVIQDSADGPRVFATNASWDSMLESGIAGGGDWHPAQTLAHYGDKPWRVPPVQGPALPILRKEFTLPAAPKRAVLYICGLGQFELHINGQVLSSDLLQPGWTDYRKTCLYVGYDVTSLLKPGANAIGVMLGNGMYNSTPGRYTKFIGSMGSPQVIAQMTIENQDGSVQHVATDQTWKVAAGPITFSSIYGGEDFDASLRPPGWDLPDFADSDWASATVMNGPGGELRCSSQSAPPIRVAYVLDPVSVTPLKNGDYLYDMGQNCAMIPSIAVEGAAGAEVRIFPGELLNADGMVAQRSMGKGPMYFTFTLSGKGRENWTPSFSYYGCRYFQVRGATPPGVVASENRPTLISIEGNFITSSSAPAGEFSCSSDLFNRVATLIDWAIRSNTMSIITDCPHRERLGWLEQDHLMGPSLLYDHDLAALLTKVSGDMRDAQHKNGLVPDIAPEYVNFKNAFQDSPEWGSASVMIPWMMYKWYGDTQVLGDSYEMMKNYVGYLSSKSKDGLVSYGLGDWYDLGPHAPGVSQLTPIPLTATAFYYRDLCTVADTARVLGNGDDAREFDARAAIVKEAFNKAFYHADRKFYATGSQTANAMPVVFGLAPAADVPAIVDHIVADMKSRGDGLTAGDVGYRFVLQALAEHGKSDEIFEVNNQTDRPGYGLQLARGATSLTEAWDANPNASQDHLMLGHLFEWFYRDLAGIQPADDSVAWDKVVIKPAMAGDITWAKARYDSIRGPISTEWHRDSTGVRLGVTIPPGVTGTVYIPAKSQKSVHLTDGKFLRMDGDDAVFEIESGKYQFSTE
jgi:hypothetical protein